MAEKHEPEKEHRYCPYCDSEIAEAAFPYCEACEVEIFYCPECRKPVPRDKQTCPHCGSDISKEAKKGK
jgi:RNA polymerase subunit RPABC4/transcription elongation factor Spt4